MISYMFSGYLCALCLRTIISTFASLSLVICVGTDVYVFHWSLCYESMCTVCCSLSCTASVRAAWKVTTRHRLAHLSRQYCCFLPPSRWCCFFCVARMWFYTSQSDPYAYSPIWDMHSFLLWNNIYCWIFLSISAIYMPTKSVLECCQIAIHAPTNAMNNEQNLLSTVYSHGLTREWIASEPFVYTCWDLYFCRDVCLLSPHTHTTIKFNIQWNATTPTPTHPQSHD